MIKPLTHLSIDGKALFTFESLNLSQSINHHHEFEVVLDQDVIEQRGAHTIDKSKNWLGKSIVIAFAETSFLGVITNVKLKQTNGYYGHIVISGYSKTILLEGGKHMQSWLNKDLEKIVKEIVGDVNIEAEVKPRYASPYEYQAQYQETHFQFLQRLAKQHNEWLYYDGEKLIFGKPKLKSALELEYERDIDEIDISISAIPSKQSVFSYHPLDDKRHNSGSRDTVSGLSDLGNFAFNVSKDLYPIVPNGFSSTRVKDQSEINDSIRGQQSSAVSQGNLLTASSRHKGLTVGTVIKVTARMMKSGTVETRNYGEFIIISIKHTATGLDEYSNHFEAVSSGVEFLSAPDVALPTAQAQIATVLSNDDPEKKGRVEVQFQWQSSRMKTSWVRVMTPDAGSSNEVDTNRGFVFVPEEGDQVMVSFRYNDPNRPFVMGSMFSGTTGAGGKVNNNIKSTITKSGHTIEFDDSPKSESITITDKNENIIFIDTANSSIQISAPENISISAKNIDITASENLTLTAGDNIGISAGDDMNLSTGDSMTFLANEDFTILAKNITEQAAQNFESLAINIQEHAETVMKASAKEDLELNSSGNISNNSGSKIKLF